MKLKDFIKNILALPGLIDAEFELRVNEFLEIDNTSDQKIKFKIGKK